MFISFATLSAVGHEQSAMCSTGSDLKQQSFFEHILTSWSEVLRDQHALQNGDDCKYLMRRIDFNVILK